MKNMKNYQKIKQEKGSITLFVLISMVFILVAVLGIYFNSSSKAQKQYKEIEKIQKEGVYDGYRRSKRKHTGYFAGAA